MVIRVETVKMHWDSIFKLAAVLITFAGTAVALAKYFSGQQKTLTALRDEIKELKNQTKILKQPIEHIATFSTPNTYQQLLTVSTDARIALAADIHSISIPVPSISPTHLRIILSSDPEPEKVVGREFPISKGISGWVYQQQQPTFKNPTESDPHYFALVDKAAGTQTGQGAILTLPLLSGRSCRGVIQFMKTKGGRFDESDIQLGSRIIPPITRLLVELQDSSVADIPGIAHGDVRDITVLISDITGFSEVAAKVRLQDSVAMLNEYYSRLLHLAIKDGGKLQEYLGDGIYISYVDEISSQQRERLSTRDLKCTLSIKSC